MTFYTIEHNGLRYCMVNGEPQFLPVDPINATALSSKRIAMGLASDYGANVEINHLTTAKYALDFVAKDDYVDLMECGNRVGFLYWSPPLNKFGYCLIPKPGNVMADPQYADTLEEAKGCLFDLFMFS